MYSVLDGCSEALGVNTGIFEKRRGNIMVLLFAFAVPRIKRQIIQIFFSDCFTTIITKVTFSVYEFTEITDSVS